MSISDKKKRSATEPEKPVAMPFGRRNYMFLIIGCAVVLLGFVLMMGGGSDDPVTFDESVFGFRQITLAPIVVLAGFGVVMYAIMTRSTKREAQ